MSEMIERVARALHALQTQQGVHVYPPYDDCKEWHKDILRRNARAAIEAMREPTDDMKQASDGEICFHARCPTCFGVAPAWHAMIDAALAD